MTLIILTASPAEYIGMSEIRSRFPVIAWGDDPPDWALASVGAVRVVPVSKPDPSSSAKVVIPAAATQVAGVWTQQWAERNKTAAEMVTAINEKKAALLLRGAPYGGKFIDVMSENALAVIGGVTSAAILANAGALSWGSPYNTHIAQDNSQVTFATAADGIAFAGSVGGWYGAVVLHARSLKDAVEAATDPTTVDITAGWPA